MKALLRCAWCNMIIGRTDTPDGATSHGICLTCARLRFPAIFPIMFAERQALALNRAAFTPLGYPGEP